MIRMLLLVGSLTTPAATAGEAPPGADAFDRFVTTNSPVCQYRPAQACVDAGFGFADANGDGKLSLDELQAVRAKLDRWIAWRGPRLQPRERGAVLFGAQIVDAIGLERLLTSYDEDGDRQVSKQELLADVRLDDRPLGEILLDERAVDRDALRRRLGAIAPAMDGLLRRSR